MYNLTGRIISKHLADAGFTTIWEGTGGPCRAVCVFLPQDHDHTGPCVRITHEFDPFTEDDHDGNVAGGLAIGLYARDEADAEPRIHIIDAYTPAEVTAVVTALLGRPTPATSGPHPTAILSHRSGSRKTAARQRSALEDAQHYVTGSLTVTALAILGYAAQELGATTVEVRIDPGGSFCIFRSPRGEVIDPDDSWDAWNDVADACASIDPESPGCVRVLYPGLDLKRTEGRHGYEYRATLPVREMIHGPSHPDEAEVEYRAGVLAKWATAMQATAASAQTDADQMHEYVETKNA